MGKSVYSEGLCLCVCLHNFPVSSFRSLAICNNKVVEFLRDITYELLSVSGRGKGVGPEKVSPTKRSLKNTFYRLVLSSRPSFRLLQLEKAGCPWYFFACEHLVIGNLQNSCDSCVVQPTTCSMFGMYNSHLSLATCTYI